MARVTAYASCAAALLIGLFFIFVWAPHPWGHAGFDQYYDLGLAIARGEGFRTIDVPWGYAYFLSVFYRLFGNRPVVPLVVQAMLNATLPLLAYAFARSEFDERVAAVAAALTGVLSFNTVYASTQSSDAVCNVIFMAAALLMVRARRSGRTVLYAASGATLGLAAQFRPNLVLLPLAAAAFLVFERRTAARAVHGAALVASAVLVLTPWIVRNYRLTGELLPTSTHGGVQLWYGTLETGPFLKSQAYNPRAVFETGSFPSTSLDRVPIVLSGRVAACAGAGRALRLRYWTDRDPARRTITASLAASGGMVGEIPPSPAPTVYYVAAAGESAGPDGPVHVFFVSTDHLGDMDAHDDLLDVFDIVALARFLAWQEPARAAGRLDLDADGKLSADDLRIAVAALLGSRSGAAPADPVRVHADDASAAIGFADGSLLAVPRHWSRRVTDLEVSGPTAAAILHATVPFAAIRAGESGEAPCDPIETLSVNTIFYRAQPDSQRRYLALAFDNIRRDPSAYAVSVLYRAVRVFFIEGSDDVHTAQQFAGGGRIYRLARIVSLALLVLSLAGIWAAKRRGAAIGLPLVLIGYIPATLGFVLINMRYSITVQPLMFMFVASALSSLAAASGHRADGAGSR
jgi:hypothetical protein